MPSYNKRIDKEICESPRSPGDGDSYKDFRRKKRWGNNVFNEEDWPANKVPMRSIYKRGWADAKDFTDNLAPVIGFLRKHVGQPWDSVYSKLCKQIGKDSWTKQHVFQHVEWEVLLPHQYRFENNVMYEIGHWSPLPVRRTADHPQLYVDAHGILRSYHVTHNAYRKAQLEKRRKHYRTAEFVHVINPTTAFRFFEGKWYRAKFEPCPPTQYQQKWAKDNNSERYFVLVPIEHHDLHGKVLKPGEPMVTKWLDASADDVRKHKLEAHRQDWVASKLKEIR